MPGYDSEVIMAAGAFVQGSSIELSADAPIKPPYNVYFQGGLTLTILRWKTLKAIEYMKKNNWAMDVSVAVARISLATWSVSPTRRSREANFYKI